jgi:hypothetical protein
MGIGIKIALNKNFRSGWTALIRLRIGNRDGLL